MTDLDLPDATDQVPEYEDAGTRPRLSLTADVLDFRKCTRKYGLYKVRGFSGSSPTAEFVGTFAHRAMEEAWQHYRTHGVTPDHATVVDILEGVRTDLLDEGRSPHSWPAVFHAGFQVARLVATMTHLGRWPEVVDSERTFRSGRDGYVLEGVVDLILETDDGLLLWDFKSANDPRRSLVDPDASPRSRRAAERMIEDYTLQLRLYHALCETVLERAPTGCRLVFLGELGRAGIDFGDYDELRAAWAATDPEPVSPSDWAASIDRARDPDEPGLFYAVDTDPDLVADAMADFEATARDILSCRERDEWPAPAVEDLPSTQTCQDCDFLQSCEPAMSQRSGE